MGSCALSYQDYCAIPMTTPPVYLSRDQSLTHGRAWLKILKGCFFQNEILSLCIHSAVAVSSPDCYITWSWPLHTPLKVVFVRLAVESWIRFGRIAEWQTSQMITPQRANALVIGWYDLHCQIKKRNLRHEVVKCYGRSYWVITATCKEIEAATSTKTAS